MRPETVSLGLLPSGSDPVGEWLVHRQPPEVYIGQMAGRRKGVRTGCTSKMVGAAKGIPARRHRITKA